MFVVYCFIETNDLQISKTSEMILLKIFFTKISRKYLHIIVVLGLGFLYKTVLGVDPFF